VRAVYGRDGVWLPTGAQAAAFDRAAQESVAEPVLMENAGRAAALVLQRFQPRGRILGFAGSGHNGGDLLVMLRTLRAWGRDVTILTTGSREPDLSLLHGHDIDVHRFSDYPRHITADVLIDGILGTGSEGPPRAETAAAIRVMNAMGRPIVALDLPSGIDANTGKVPGDVVHAACTVTFGWPKLGLLLFPAREHCGRIVAVEIGFPPVTDGDFTAEAITPGWAVKRMPVRPADAHKGTSGRLLILAGQSGMAGAAALTTRAAVRSGAGLVRIVSDTANRTVLQLAIPEAIFTDREAMTAEDIMNATAIVAGPGLGRSADARASLGMIFEHGSGIPTLLDADALNMLASEHDVLQRAAANRPLLITPHPKELARLMGGTLESVIADRVAAARDAARTLGCAVLLKGQPSLIAATDGGLLVNMVATSDVAVAGMGDQLAGVIGGFMAAGVEPMEAAGLGLFYAGRAARLAQRGRSLSPSDVSDTLSAAFADPGPSMSSLRLPFITFDQPALT
jgi:ADP-dependent NAD(P)H-hydrate dehydratase / NAD(P)H-hydrate epimerase